MMEIEDAAQITEAREWEARNAPRPPKPVYAEGDAGYGPAWCEECGEAEMPALRRQMGCRRCTPCETEAERQRARRRR